MDNELKFVCSVLPIYMYISTIFCFYKTKRTKVLLFVARGRAGHAGRAR